MSKGNWPEFPLGWLDQSKRNMSGLQYVAAHLHQKTEASGRGSDTGFRGTATEMEKQIIEQLSSLRQQVYVLTDVTLALLQIAAEDHERRSTRVSRMLGWIRETWNKFWLTIEQNMFYKIVAIVGTIVGTLAGLWGLFRHFHLFVR